MPGILETRMPVPFGRLAVRVSEEAVLAIDFQPADLPAIAPEGPLARRAIERLQRYFEDPSQPLDLPLSPAGTPFQQRVWQALLGIPAGEVMTYGDLARRLGTAPRAVGQACARNPIPIVIPCHRVVARKGLGGFMGHPEAHPVKLWLLEHERRGINRG
jgi:methylated-DNA-[protein]-cysteine S-methyltransferase